MSRLPARRAHPNYSEYGYPGHTQNNDKAKFEAWNAARMAANQKKAVAPLKFADSKVDTSNVRDLRNGNTDTGSVFERKHDSIVDKNGKLTAQLRREYYKKQLKKR